jgi:hypothetical protein
VKHWIGDVGHCGFIYQDPEEVSVVVSSGTYVAEDAVSPYVAEDGTTFYVTEV